MNNELNSAKRAAKKAILKTNRIRKANPEYVKRKKLFLRKQRKFRALHEKKSQRIGKGDEKNLRWAILATLALGVISLENPEVAVIAIFFSILIIAALFDKKLKHQHQAYELANLKRETKFLKAIKELQKKSNNLEVKKESIVPPPIERIPLNVASLKNTMREFPYKAGINVKV